ncbi:LysR family transcriptional regulator [Sedimenticola selenatireducens]|uniref:LysR family transcriptional regulator n=1 Tax=Sedimenticola selenatireducens TaxID=191960 RepID=UPI00267B92ED
MDCRIPNIRHLRVFVEVAENKSISKASEKVFLSQPAITQAITKLEGMLNTSLFQRRSDGMYVTESGEVFLMRVRRSIEMITEGVKNAIRLGGGKGQTLQLVQMLKTTQLRALIAVSEAHNFSVAGRNLGISQSALHRAARELEDLLRIVLFEKTSTGISTSKAARAL